MRRTNGAVPFRRARDRARESVDLLRALLARFLDTHAAAEAACGDTAHAAQLQQEAGGLLPAVDQWKEERAAYQQRLEKYRQK